LDFAPVGEFNPYQSVNSGGTETFDSQSSTDEARFAAINSPSKEDGDTLFLDTWL